MPAPTPSSSSTHKQNSLIEDFKTKVKVGRHGVSQTNTPAYHGTFGPAYDNSFRLRDFQHNCHVNVVEREEGDGRPHEEANMDEGRVVFDLVGVEAPIANALRRVMIAEVPTMAIETVVIVNNNSVIQDEVLAHRIGLVPIKADPRLFQMRRLLEDRMEETEAEEGEETEAEVEEEGEEMSAKMQARRNREIYKRNGGYGGPMPGVSADVAAKSHLPRMHLYEYETLLFKLDVTCKRKPGTGNGANSAIDHEDEIINANVYSSDLKWVPFGNQAELFKDDPIRPVHDDILLCKLRPGQSITVECYCYKGIGKDHAKFSPVSTATYRLMPEIVFKKPVVGEKAKELKKTCPTDVFDIEDGEAIVSRPRNCTMCRECIREDEWNDRIALQRVKNHFIFSVESTGCTPSEDVFLDSVDVLKQKCLSVKRTLNRMRR